MSTLRLILGDQLNASHSWFQCKDPSVTYLIAELHQETGYVRHHVQKVCAFFAAMQAFAEALAKAGHRVIHLTLDDSAPFQDLPALIAHQVTQLNASRFEYQQPDEYRLARQLGDLNLPGVEVVCMETEHFYVPHAELGRYARAGECKQMEAFYRRMRVAHDVLMDSGKPFGGRWNFDSDNRNKMPAKALPDIPAPLLFSNSVVHILDRLQRHQVKTMGEPQSQLVWPVTRSQALQLLSFFCDQLLPFFGRYQDAMTCNSDHSWSLYHSRLSFALNAKIISPRQVVNAAANAWKQHPDKIGLAQVEGFVRQVLGWREFVRVIYWANMPGYRSLNALQAERPLPSWFWTGETKMNCLRQAITQSLVTAYAHHIQRLMIVGNFALIAGLDPDPLDDWYLGIYIDAIEWVELPNTRGMSQYADGGIVGSKPYAAGGAYVNRMSDYCADCWYKVKEKTGARACPLNSLYWHFLHRHQSRLGNNRRLGLAYANWTRLAQQQKDILARADDVLSSMETL